jgi:uncharacterized protein (DUF952 family)
MVAMSVIYKIAERQLWAAAAAAGHFDGSVHDLRDGFIHFSTASQARETAAKHFAGQQDLVLAAIDTTHLGQALKWEPSRDGALFPHLYATLAMTSVEWTKLLPLGDDGRHVFPVEMQ